MLDQLQVPLGRRGSIGDTNHYHCRSTLGSFGTQKIDRRYIPLPCQINFKFLWDPEDRQEIHTITMLDQLQVPLGPRRLIGDTYHYHVRSTLGSFGTQKIDRRYIPLPCQINFRFLWDPEDRQEIHTITMLDQLQVPLGPRRSIGDTYHYHVRSTFSKVPLGPRRSIGDTHHYHVRSTLGSFRTQKIDRRYIPLPCQINFRFLWDPEDRQEIHTITMLDQLQVPLGPRRSIGDPYHYHVRSILGSSAMQRIDRRYTPLSCQINSRLLWNLENRQEIHTIIMLDQLQAPLGRRRSIGDTHHYHVRSTLSSSGTQKIDRRYTPLSCQINSRLLWNVEDR